MGFLANNFMKDITIIIPVHKIDKFIEPFLQEALMNIVECRVTYKNGKLPLILVCSDEAQKDVKKAIKDKNIEDVNVLVNSGDTDFCSQINKAVEEVNTDYFSILEVDDVYNPDWFNMAEEYYPTNTSTSLFLPINIMVSSVDGVRSYCNEIAWAGSFSNEIGYLDFDALKDYTAFNITGGIFNTNDFKEVGGFKPSLGMAFYYEYLLRITNKKLRVFVVPKEGYVHLYEREGSLTDEWAKKYSIDEIGKYFELAKLECYFKEDRCTSINTIKEEKVK